MMLENLIQGSTSWHDWRRLGIGSSDAPIIMRESPYSTPFKLYEEKLGLRESFQGNWATERGQRLEPQVRAHYELLHDCEMNPLNVVHQSYPFLRASLDGANVDLKRCLEIKCMGKKTFEATKENKTVPKHHFVQVQHQLLVTGFEVCHYYSFFEGEGVLIEIEPDLKFMQILLSEELLFWHCIEKRIPPALMPADLKVKRKRKVKSNEETPSE